MGLSAGFKQYIADHFPECYTKLASPARADVFILDAMVVLHRFRVDVESRQGGAHQLADMLFYMLWDAEVAAICFDDVHQTTRAKEVEWTMRTRTTGACDPLLLEELLAKHELPTELDDFIADRFLRQRLNTYLRDELFKRMRLSRGMTTMQRLVVFNADGPPMEGCWPSDAGEAPFEDDDLLVQMRPDWHAALTGEGELCCVRAAMLLRNSVPSRAPDASARIVVSTCDTDAVLIALVNTFPGLYVELSHFDRKLGAASYVDIDTHMLKTNIEKRLRITTHDFVVIAISKGSDFVKQSVAGIANWHDYVKTCSEHIRARGAVVVAATAREAHVNVARVDTMLHSLGVLSKRVQVKYQSANHLKRIVWNWLYVAYGVSGLASEELGKLEKYGWAIKSGVMSPDDAPLSVRDTQTIQVTLV